jgi:glutamate carboxypeptidase
MREQREDMSAYLEELVRCESPSTVPESQERVLDILSDSLDNLNYRPMRLMGRDTGSHLYAPSINREKCRPLQLILGHCDTVWPIGTLARMPIGLQGGEMTGPGIFDMKGGLTQMVFALRAMQDLKLTPPLEPVIFVNSDEEIGSPDSSRHIRRLARISARALVLEPALGRDGKLKTSRKGTGRFTVRITGKSSHAGLNPDDGASAIVELSHVIQQLHALNDFTRGISINVGMIQGGLRPNVVAPESSAIVDVRVRTHDDASMIEAKLKSIQAVTPGTTVLIEGTMGRPPMEASPRNQQLWKTAQLLGKSIDIDLEEGASGGASDGNTTSLFTATLDGLGSVGDGAHAEHEFIYLDQLVERTALLTLILMEKPQRES